MSDQTTQVRSRHLSGLQMERVGPYLAAAFLSLAIFSWVTELWKADFNIPFAYYAGGDLFWNVATIKGLMENGSYLVNPNLGAPFGLYGYDFPTSQALHFFLLRILTVFTGNCAATINVFYVLSYPMTALSALWVFRRFDIGAIPAVICSLFYTFLLAHFARGMNHLALACYYYVPLLFWVVLTVASPRNGQPPGCLKELLKSRWFLGRLAVCVAIGSDGFYNSFFGMFFLACGGLFAWAVNRYRTGFLTSLVLIGATLVTSFCNVLPNIVFWAREGTNPAAVVRAALHAEIYGLKLTNLLLPIPDSRIPVLARIRQFYMEQSGASEGATTVGLGLIGSLGFVLLLALCLFRSRRASTDHLFDLLATLNLMGVLLATVGGFGSILAFLGFTAIRAYNRIFVFLAFLAFMAVALFWQKLEKRYSGSRPVFIAVSLLVASFGLWEEIPASVAPNYALSRTQWTEDANYVAILESSIPPGSTIFQLPYVPFPEYPQVVDMTDYSHFRPYLHSKRLRWSYGAIRGRKGAAWMEATSVLPLSRMVQAVAEAGYAGIYIDRFGYADRAAALETQIAGLFGTTPLVSGDNRLAYFGLGPKKGASPVEAKWEGEFSLQETLGTENWRWCGNSGVLRLINKSKDPAWVRLGATVKTAWPEDAKVHVKDALFADELVTSVNGLEWERVVAVPPGEHVITFTSTARKNSVSGAGDSRVLVFALYNFTLTRAEMPPGGIDPERVMQRPVQVIWGSGTYPEENGKTGVWHWCSTACEIAMVNPSTTPAHVRVTMAISTGHDKPAKLTIKGPGIFETVPVVIINRSFAYTLELPPGKSLFKMSCDAPRALVPADPRSMVFMVTNFTLRRVSGDSQ